MASGRPFSTSSFTMRPADMSLWLPGGVSAMMLRTRSITGAAPWYGTRFSTW